MEENSGMVEFWGHKYQRQLYGSSSLTDHKVLVEYTISKAVQLEQLRVLNGSLRSGIGPHDGGWNPNMATK